MQVVEAGLLVAEQHYQDSQRGAPGVHYHAQPNGHAAGDAVAHDERKHHDQELLAVARARLLQDPDGRGDSRGRLAPVDTHRRTEAARYARPRHRPTGLAEKVPRRDAQKRSHVLHEHAVPHEVEVEQKADDLDDEQGGDVRPGVGAVGHVAHLAVHVLVQYDNKRDEHQVRRTLQTVKQRVPLLPKRRRHRVAPKDGRRGDKVDGGGAPHLQDRAFDHFVPALAHVAELTSAAY
mmetsp:Transcript_17395/g.44213  ORF Transcript_17395/g.44213 Transcript_17395/m.44213 type:complete len:235 (-) Transcript_17395:581-1285(-)